MNQHDGVQPARDASPQTLPEIAVVTSRLSPREREGETTTVRAHGRETFRSAHWPLSRLSTDAMDYLDLLSLRELDLSGQHFPVERLGSDDVAELSVEQSLMQLTVHGVSVSPSALIRKLPQLPRLISIDLSGLDLTDEDTAVLTAAVPQLRRLKLGARRPSDNYHSFDCSRLTTNVWSAVASLRDLTSLSVRDVPLDDAMVSASPAVLTGLEALDLGDTQIGDATAALLTSSRNLRRLAVDGTKIGNEGAAALADIGTLDDLDISRTRIGEAGLTRLLQLGRFVRLGLAEIQAGDATFAAVGGLGELEDLDLSRTSAGSATLSALSSLPRLKRLNLDQTRLGAAELSVLSSSSVRDLSLRSVRIGRDGIAAIARLSQLQAVSIDVGADWTGLDDLAASVSLAAAPPAVIRLPKLLRKLRLTGALTAPLRDSLGGLGELEELSIRSGGDLLADIHSNGLGRLKRVVAEASGLDDAALDRLAILPEMEEIYVSDNRVSRSVSRLRNPYLNTLELRNTDVDDTAIEALATLPRLHCLDLPNTNVTPAGIADLVSSAPNLQSLALDGTQVTDATVTAMAGSALLIELYLYGESVTDDTLLRLRDLVNVTVRPTPWLRAGPELD